MFQGDCLEQILDSLPKTGEFHFLRGPALRRHLKQCFVIKVTVVDSGVKTKGLRLSIPPSGFHEDLKSF